MNPKLYEQDYYLWLKKTVNALQEGRLSELDIENLAEEINDMAKNQQRAVKSNLTVILWHLLKYKYQSKKRNNSWRLTLFEHRDRLAEAFLESPSLKPLFQEIFEECYQKARKKAAIETELSINTFPEECPSTQEEVLDFEYLPD